MSSIMSKMEHHSSCRGDLDMACNMELFFTHDHGDVTATSSTTDSATADTSTTSSSNSTSNITFLHGPPRAHLSSLLVHFSFSHARRGRSVVLVSFGGDDTRGDAGGVSDDASPAPKLDVVSLEPCACCGLPVRTGGDSLVWQRIQIKCVHMCCVCV
ncbi:hypothetical protein PybrP1_003156 [[Pythium] brassicae (nom. inval.)]|nr:hypothetical protein PybrP1_003156 [[Pythium] brassicae (nom. inval.)]